MTTYYKHYNPNPKYSRVPGKKEKAWAGEDCTTRAFCAALNKSWMDIFKAQIDISLEICDMPNSTRVLDCMFKKYGFVKCSYKRGQKRETIKLFCKNHPVGTYILRLAGHIVCVKDGRYYDAWDSGDMTAYSYYELPAEK